jgi:hypothetical protein
VWRNLNRYEFPGPIYLINPRRTEIWDRPCYPDFKSLPEAPDHMVVLVPANGVAGCPFVPVARGRQADCVEELPRCLIELSHVPHDVHVADVVAVPRIHSATVCKEGLGHPDSLGVPNVRVLPRRTRSVAS